MSEAGRFTRNDEIEICGTGISFFGMWYLIFIIAYNNF
jgi:hypothetical protein